MPPGRLVLSGVLGASGVSAGDGGELKGSESCAGRSFAAVAVLQRRGSVLTLGVLGALQPKAGAQTAMGRSDRGAQPLILGASGPLGCWAAPRCKSHH